ncbi:MAG TPA: zinc ribbon domain-containing protein [Solirubrobacteraceae bacterium]|nr:zinc ribbon domain-containing protein [Solirubrobacteraceae bacterium]
MPHAVPDEGSASLRRKREDLVAQVAELHWDLGGLAYEMAIRDHFRLDVLVRKAAELQERDAELGELERVLSLQENAGAGECSSCGALRSRGAAYCWQCGTALMDRAPDPAANGAASAPADGAHRPEAPSDGGHPEVPTVALPPGQPAS